MYIEFFSQQNDTKIIKFNKGVFFYNSAVLQSGEGTQRNSSLPKSWLLIQKKQILKMTLLQRNGSRIKTPSSKSLILVSLSWKKNFLHIYALTNLI